MSLRRKELTYSSPNRHPYDSILDSVERLSGPLISAVAASECSTLAPSPRRAHPGGVTSPRSRSSNNTVAVVGRLLFADSPTNMVAARGLSRSCSPQSGDGGVSSMEIPGSDELEIRQLLACRKVVGAVRNELEKGVYELPPSTRSTTTVQSSSGGNVTNTESSIYEAVGELARTYSSADSDLVIQQHHNHYQGEAARTASSQAYRNSVPPLPGGSAFGINQSVHSGERSTSERSTLSANKCRRVSDASYNSNNIPRPHRIHRHHPKEPLALPARPIKEVAEIRFVNADDAGKYQQKSTDSATVEDGDDAPGDTHRGWKAAAGAGAVEVELPGHIYKALSDTLFGGGGATAGGSEDGDAMYACSLEGHATTNTTTTHGSNNTALNMHRPLQHLGYSRGDGGASGGLGVVPHISIIGPSLPPVVDYDEDDDDDDDDHQDGDVIITHQRLTSPRSTTMPFKRLPPKTFPHHWYPIDAPGSSPTGASSTNTHHHHHHHENMYHQKSPHNVGGMGTEEQGSIPSPHHIDTHRRPSLDVGSNASHPLHQGDSPGGSKKDGQLHQDIDSNSLPSPKVAETHDDSNNNNTHHSGLVSSRLTSVSQFGRGGGGSLPKNFHFDDGEEFRNDLQTAILEGFSANRRDHKNSDIDIIVTHPTEEIEVDTRTQQERVKHQKRRCRALVALVDDVLKKKYNMDPPPPPPPKHERVVEATPTTEPGSATTPGVRNTDTAALREGIDPSSNKSSSLSSAPHQHREAKIVPIVNLDGSIEEGNDNDENVEDGEGDEMYASPPRHQPTSFTTHHTEDATQEGSDHNESADTHDNESVSHTANGGNHDGGDEDYSVPRDRKMAAVLVSTAKGKDESNSAPSDAQYVPPPPPMGGYCSPRLLRSRGAEAVPHSHGLTEYNHQYEQQQQQQHQQQRYHGAVETAVGNAGGEEEGPYHRPSSYHSPPDDVYNYDANIDSRQQPHHNHPHLFPSPTSTVYNGGMLGLTPMTPPTHRAEEEDISGLVADMNKGLFLRGSMSGSENGGDGDELELDIPAGYGNTTAGAYNNNDNNASRTSRGGADSSRREDLRRSKSRALLMEQALGRSRRDHLIEVCKAALAVGGGGSGGSAQHHLSNEEMSLLSSTLNGSAMYPNSEKGEVVRLRRLLAKAMEGKKRESSQLIDREVSLQRGESLSRSRSRNASVSQSNNNYKDNNAYRQESHAPPHHYPRSYRAPTSSSASTGGVLLAPRATPHIDEEMSVTPTSDRPSPIRHPSYRHHHHYDVDTFNRTEGSTVITEFDAVVSPGRTHHGRRSIPTTVYVGMGMPPPTPTHNFSQHQQCSNSPSSSRDSKSFFSVTSPPTH